MAAPAKKKRKKDTGYQQKRNAVCIVLYDQTGETISPVAKQEAEEAITQVAFNHNCLVSITET
jgi:hypothetical protein